MPSRKLRFFLRRVVYFGLVLASVTLASALMYETMAKNGLSALRVAAVLLFSVAFGWQSMSFWSAMFGFVDRLRGCNALGVEPEPRPLRARTAVVMPIFDEEPRRVVAGLEAIVFGLADTGDAAAFDVFVLSDSKDPHIVAEERAALGALRVRCPEHPSLYYRRRRVNTRKKAGNIEDFVRRWGNGYAHMIVLDADSVMSGATLVDLARAMEAHPETGIIQTVPIPANRETAFARILQFASNVYGPLSASGLASWCGDHANYYGHNAIVRVAAFARHCGLPTLPGRPPLGGEILSHDFVEAGLMERGGYSVWLVPHFDESYEELPSNLVDYAARDRRWCQGNLQHWHLLGLPGLKALSRLHLLLGVASYLSSPVWFSLLVVSTADAIERAATGPEYFKPGFNLFPTWPVATDFELHLLLAITLATLFVPKFLGLTLILCGDARPRRDFGGAGGLLVSVVLETVFSSLLAPIMMLFESRFVVSILLGRSVAWGPQPRDDRGLGWNEGFARHGWQTLVGVVWGGTTLLLAPDFFWWLAPVLAGLLVAVPLSVWSSRATFGRSLRRLGLFLIPEETRPTDAFRRVMRALARSPEGAIPTAKSDDVGALVPAEAGLPMPHLDWRRGR